MSVDNALVQQYRSKVQFLCGEVAYIYRSFDTILDPLPPSLEVTLLADQERSTVRDNIVDICSMNLESTLLPQPTWY